MTTPQAPGQLPAAAGHLDLAAGHRPGERADVLLITHYGHARCQPDRAPGFLDRKIVDQVTEYVDAELSGTLTLDRLARVAGLSPFHLARAFKAATGVSPHQFVMARRMHRATLLLTGTAMPVPQVAAAGAVARVPQDRTLRGTRSACQHRTTTVTSPQQSLQDLGASHVLDQRTCTGGL